MSYKHLTLDDRIYIQESLNNGENFASIARAIGKSKSTISREILNHRLQKKSKSNKPLPCLNISKCNVTHLCPDFEGCNDTCNVCPNARICVFMDCPSYLPKLCKTLNNPPYVCNNCSRKNSCGYEHYLYIATYAHNQYQTVLISNRQGINQTPERLDEIDHMVSPLIKQGQSLSHIYATHADEIQVSKATLYRYIDKRILSVMNLDLPRKVRYKVRKNNTRKSVTTEEKMAIKNRDYKCFLEYIKQFPETNIVEMDTVVGPIGSQKVLLTLLFRNCSLMIAILLPHKTQECVINALNYITELIGIECFQRMFGVILTDRGTEFLSPEAIECDQYGEIKTRLFYCDPLCSWQKGTLERNHEFIRYIVPKGKSFDNYTQEDISLMINHINSVKRAGLNNLSPFELSELLIDHKIHDALNLIAIDPDKIVLKPCLLSENNK